MSATNRSTVRWPSSVKSNITISHSAHISPVRRKFSQPLAANHPHALTQRMAKTRNDVEQLFKLYYSTNIKFDTFQRQVVTGTRIPSAQTPSLMHNHFTNSSINVFRSKHCVSREEGSPIDMNEHLIINDESGQNLPKRTVEVRIDQLATMCQSSDGISLPINSDNPSSSNNFNESTLMKSLDSTEDVPSNSFEYNPSRKNQSTIPTLPPIPPSSTLSLINNHKDLINSSHSSFSTLNSHQPHIVTGSAVIVRERSPAKSVLNKQRIKSSSQYSHLKTRPVSIQYDQPQLPLSMGARVVSIPSKCSRYVLLSFPQAPMRYQCPNYVERILLPERFPTLFQNIVHHRNQK